MVKREVRTSKPVVEAEQFEEDAPFEDEDIFDGLESLKE